MNLVLLDTPDMISETGAIVRGRRARHIIEIHRAARGKELRVGLLGGNIGTAVVEDIRDGTVCFSGISLTQPPPKPPGLDFILAVPRPKVLTRVLETASTLGVKHIVLLNSARVEKSYFSSPRMDGQAVREALIRGLEQSVDTILPTVQFEPLFRPYIEDRASSDFAGALMLAAHPGSNSEPIGKIFRNIPFSSRQRIVAALGPEGGFVPFEINLLQNAGFRLFSLGKRILRVESALSFVAGQLSALAFGG